MSTREHVDDARPEPRPGDLVLALDTATTVVAVALGPRERSGAGPAASPPGGGTVLGRRVPTERRHAEVLVPTIRDLLREAGVTIGDLGAIVAGVGPGLFTGLRVGVTTARTLARASAVPVVGVSSLAAVAAGARSGDVVAVLDARRGEVFWSRFVDGERRSDDVVDAPEALAAALVPPVTLVGDGAHRYAAVLDRPGVTIHADGAPDPVGLWRLGLEALAAGASTDPAALVPNYLRRTDAEIAWDRRGS